MLAGFYFDKSNTLVEPQKFRTNLQHNIFSYKGFWKQILISFYEGTACYFLVVMSFSEAVDFNGRTVDDTAMGTLLFLVVLNVVNLKLQLVLVQWSSIACFISILATIAIVIFLLLINDKRVHSLLGVQNMIGLVPEELISARGILVLVSVPFIVVFPGIFSWTNNHVQSLH